MKKIVILSVMLFVLAAILAGNASASVQVLNHGFLSPVALGAGDQWNTLDLGVTGLWKLECSGGTTLTATNAAASLTGAWADKNTDIWKFQYSNDGSSWTDLPSLVSSTTAGLSTTVVASQNALPVIKNTRWIRLGYNVIFTGANARTSGTAGMVATAVPEPSSAVALATGVVGIIGLLKKRKH